jgi:hypothetical protein
MKAPRRKPEPIASQLPLPEASEARTRAYSPELTAKLAVARRPTTPSGHRVKFAVTLFLPPDLAEYLIARAIREGKNTAGLIGEILAAERGRHG